MTKLQDLMDLIDLQQAIADGYVRSRSHPDMDRLVILNYTEKAQYERVWTDVTRQCRGLIIDRVSGNVFARPFDKFFNVGEYALEGGTFGRAQMDLDAQVRTVDKLDGSLGILYMAPDGLPAIATRGSFTSDQAQHATALLRERYADWVPRPNLTYLFEIIYPENRIVLDYGDQDDLILLGARTIESGRVIGPDVTDLLYGPGWYGPRAEVLPPTTFAEALAFGDRTNREGLVVTFEHSGLMVKIKQEDYVRLHRLVTGLNERVVWEHMSQNHGLVLDLIRSVPDEFHQWVADVANRFSERYEILSGRAHHAYHEIVSQADGDLFDPSDWQRQHRRWFAEQARGYSDLTPLLFQLLDGRDISASIWKTLKPKGQTQSLMNRTEDNA